MDLLCVFSPTTFTIADADRCWFVKENFHPSGLRNNRRKWNVMIVALNERTNERNSNKRKGGGGGVEDEEEVLEWGQAVLLLLLFWNTASLFSLWLDEVLSWEKRIFFFICVCLFVPSRIDSRLLVFRIRLPVTLSVKGEKKKNQKGRRRNPTWRNHTSLKRSSSLVLRRQKKRPKFYFFLSFSRRIRIDGWASNRLGWEKKINNALHTEQNYGIGLDE